MTWPGDVADGLCPAGLFAAIDSQTASIQGSSDRVVS